MIKEDKELLLKDLCARLPYGVKTQHIVYGFVGVVKSIYYGLEGIEFESKDKHYDIPIEEIRPYLRPLSSMTEEELREFSVLKFKNDDIWEIDEFLEMKFGFKGFINILCRNRNSGDTWMYQVNTRTPLETYYATDWLNAHHFDYRGLIEKGLAIEAPKDMYKED